MNKKSNEQKSYVCCICGRIKTGYGNDPWPVVMNPKQRCCDNCNKFVVVPARMAKSFIDKGEM